MAYYQDINQSILRNPGSHDIVKKFDVESVKQSIRNILLTAPGEKLFNPQFGVNLNALLFELMTPATKILAQRQIIQAIQLWEPRVNVVSCVVDTTETTLTVDLEFYVVAVPMTTPATVTISMNRVR